MHWYRVPKHTDVRARVLADAHYNRQTIGAPQFTPPGNKIVLIIPHEEQALAVWASHRPDPNADLPMRRRDGFDYWDNPIFRREVGCPALASELIYQALQVTLWYWREQLPPDGFHTFIDPKQVNPIMRRGVPTWGYTYELAGFELHPERTKERNLMRFILSREKLEAIQPAKPKFQQVSLFEVEGAVQ